jgi:hypothetical protein
MDDHYCRGYSKGFKRCKRVFDLDPNGYCATHEYYNDFTEVEINKIKNKSPDVKLCHHCGHYHFNTCNKCNTRQKLKYKEKKSNNKCLGKSKEQKPCFWDKINNTNYCEVHSYMINYNEEQLSNLKKCNVCKYEAIVPCNNCSNRPVIEKKKQYKDKIECSSIKKKTGKKCTFKVKENGLCGYHLEKYKKNIANSERVCNCCNKTVLSYDYVYKTCKSCRDQMKADKKLINMYIIKLFLQLSNHQSTEEAELMKKELNERQIDSMLKKLYSFKDERLFDMLDKNNIPKLGYLECIDCGNRNKLTMFFTDMDIISDICQDCLIKYGKYKPKINTNIIQLNTDVEIVKLDSIKSTEPNKQTSSTDLDDVEKLKRENDLLKKEIELLKGKKYNNQEEHDRPDMIKLDQSVDTKKKREKLSPEQLKINKRIRDAERRRQKKIEKGEKPSDRKLDENGKVIKLTKEEILENKKKYDSKYYQQNKKK